MEGTASRSPVITLHFKQVPYLHKPAYLQLMYAGFLARL